MRAQGLRRPLDPRSVAFWPGTQGPGRGTAAPKGGRVEETSLPEPGSSPEERIRALGFDPDHLAPDEWDELLEFHTLYPDEALGA